jgi:hypothetical protein
MTPEEIAKLAEQVAGIFEEKPKEKVSGLMPTPEKNAELYSVARNMSLGRYWWFDFLQDDWVPAFTLDNSNPAKFLGDAIIMWRMLERIRETIGPSGEMRFVWVNRAELSCVISRFHYFKKDEQLSHVHAPTHMLVVAKVLVEMFGGDK